MSSKINKLIQPCELIGWFIARVCVSAKHNRSNGSGFESRTNLSVTSSAPLADGVFGGGGSCGDAGLGFGVVPRNEIKLDLKAEQPKVKKAPLSVPFWML